MARVCRAAVVMVAVFGAVQAKAGAHAEPNGAGNPCGPGIFVTSRQVGEPVLAWFGARSYRPDTTATLWVRARAARATLRLWHILSSDWWSEVTPASELTLHGTRRVLVQLGEWPSGLYLASVETHSGSFSAPFIVRPRRPGEQTVAVVLPTNTWAAYNLRNADADPYGDTWYADPSVDTVELARPFLKDGLPPHFGRFLHWFSDHDLSADFYSDEDLNAFSSGDRLEALYDLIVFPDHEEYVTEHMFSIVERYRDLGGNLAFLSANNFFSRVRIRGGHLTCLGHFRSFGRPEAQLMGVQYVDWNHGRYRNRPYVVRSISAAPWLFEGTSLRAGDTFGFAYGIEIDAIAPSSPPGTSVIAEIPSIFGPGKTAQMTYYRTQAGAKVFAAGAMNFAAPQSAVTNRMLRNLWDYLGSP